MPNAVKTRPTTDREYIFLFSKSDEYYYDVDAIREPHVTFVTAQPPGLTGAYVAGSKSG